MAIETAVNIDVNVDGTSTVQQAANAYEDLGDAVSKTQLEAERLAHQFGINDARTQEAIKRAGQYKNEMEQLDFAIEAAKGGSDQLFRATQGVVGGFEAAVGAMALFGGESEELEAALLKVQGAMALSQGLKDFNEFLPAIKNVTKSVVGPLSNAFKSFGKVAKTAIASTGIGLLVVAVGTLVAYWDDIKAAVSGLSEEQKKLLKDQQEAVTASEEQLNNISAQENILRQQGKTEQEILNIKIAASKNAITALEAQLETQKQLKRTQVEAAEQNQKIAAGVIAVLTIPITLLLGAVDALTYGLQKVGAIDEATNLVEEYAMGAGKLVFDPEEVAKNADDSIKETETKLNQLKNSVAGYEMAVTKIQTDQQKERENRQKAADEKEDQRLKERLAKEKEIARQRELLDKDQFEQRRILAEREFNQMVDGLDKESQAYLDAIAIRDAKLTQIEADQKQKRIDELNAQVEEEVALQEYLAQIDAENKQKEIEREQAVQDAKNAIFDESVKLGDAIIALAGESSKVGKAIALAQIGADTARALSGALANANSPTPDNVATGGLAGIAKYIALATTILSNAKRAYNIIKAPAPSARSTPSRPSAPGVPQMAAPRLGGVLNPENEITQQRKVYVVESDITSTQAKVSNTQKVSLVE